MAKLKKEVAKLKISHFLKQNQLVLVYHYIHNLSAEKDSIKKQLAKMGQITSMLVKNKIAQKAIVTDSTQSVNNVGVLACKQKDYQTACLNQIETPSLQMTHDIGTRHCATHPYKRFNPANVETFVSEKESTTVNDSSNRAFTRMEIKENIVSFNPATPSTERPIRGHRLIRKGSKAVIGQDNDEFIIDQKVLKHLKTHNSLTSVKRHLNIYTNISSVLSLLQGPTILLGCADLNKLEELLFKFDQENGFILLGGLYKDSLINHLEIQRLARSVNQGVFSRLIYQTKYCPLQPLLSIQSEYSFNFLYTHREKLITILKIRQNQLSLHHL